MLRRLPSRSVSSILQAAIAIPPAALHIVTAADVVTTPSSTASRPDVNDANDTTDAIDAPLEAHLRLPLHGTAIDAPVALFAPPPGGDLRIPARAPGVLVPLYVSFGTLQALDYHSTGRALESGAGREANPLAKGIVKSEAGLIAAKAAATAGVIVAGEMMWKKNRVAAVLFVAGMNVAMGVVVAHNYSVGRIKP